MTRLLRRVFYMCRKADGGKMYKFSKGLYSDVRVEDRYVAQIVVSEDEVRQCRELREKKAFLRVYDGKKWYYASTDDVNRIQDMLNELAEYASPDDGIDENPVVKAFEVNKDVIMRFADNCVADVPLERKADFIKRTTKNVKSDYAKVVNAVYADRYSVYEFCSSKGADIKYDFQTSGCVVSVQFANGEEKAENYYVKNCNCFDKLVNAVSTDEFVKETEDMLLRSKKLEKPGRYPVVLSPSVTGVFAHESFGHKSEADFMLGDETMAKEWKIGKKVGSEKLSIVDSGLIDGGGYVPYDDEGTKATRTYLIKNGVLTGRLHSAETAVYLGEKLTGNARAIDCGFEPIVRMTSTFVEGGKDKVEDLFKGIKHGYYIKNYKHGSGMSTFTIAPIVSYEIVDGKIGDPVRIAVITGNVFETLSLIDGVADDEELESSPTGGCGKMEQYPLSVATGGPHVRVSAMNVQ